MFFNVESTITDFMYSRFLDLGSVVVINFHGLAYIIIIQHNINVQSGKYLLPQPNIS